MHTIARDTNPPRVTLFLYALKGFLIPRSIFASPFLHPPQKCLFGGQRGRVLMGDGVLEGGSVFKHLLIQIHPFRKHIWALCALCLLLSLLIILNSVLIISIQGSSPYRLGDPTFVIFSEVLAWLLIMVSVLGVKLTCMSNKIVEANAEAHRRRTGDDGTSLPPPLPSVAIEVDGPDFVGQRRPFSAPQWVNAYWGLSSDGIAAGENPFGLPGVVEPQPPFDPFLFPPPPPRYSSLEGPRVASLGGTRLSPPRPRGGRVGDLCTQNTDCQVISIGGFENNESSLVRNVLLHWPVYLFDQLRADLFLLLAKYFLPFCVAEFFPIQTPAEEVNPGDSGCVEDVQCEAVWPGARCARSGICKCPDHYVPAKTRDGTMCITVIETDESNGGDGSTWCVYPDGERDLPIADLYNCVPHPQVRPEYFPEYAPTVDGICCHSRGCRRGSAQFQRPLRTSIPDEFPVSNCVRHSGSCAPENICVQIGSLQNHAGGRTFPLGALVSSRADTFDAGTQIAGTVPTSRFYYDAEQGRCTNFLYEGGLGNFNNFVTKQDCENFCSKLVCEFGQPLRVAEGQWQRCESGKRGRIQIGANCTAPASDCPSTHGCDSSHRVCCPTAQTICTQPKRLGECTASASRYWYNAVSELFVGNSNKIAPQGTRQCELFDFTGCQGNDNNFEHLMECQMKCRNIASEPRCPQGRAHRDLFGLFTRCSMAEGCPPNHECHSDGQTFGCCPMRAWICSLGGDRGTQCGAGRSFRFFFNADKQSCESFQYEGCDGNGNNFQSLESCQEYCGVGGCPNGGQPLRELVNNQFLSCSESQPCPNDDSHECVPVNANGLIAHRCCPTKAHICSQPPQVGTACRKASLTRWYFNIVTRECGKFGFGGCNGNLNNFESREQCFKFCSSAACAPGEIAYRGEGAEGDETSLISASASLLSPRLFDVVQCDPHVSQSHCPRDFRCVRDELGHRHVCCGSPPSDVCAEGEKAFWNGRDEMVRECQANVAGSCPADYLCRFSVAHNKYFCCAPRNGNVCPDGRALFRASKTLQPLRCIFGSKMSVVEQCPEGFSCQSRVPDDLQGNCCSIDEICRGGMPFLPDDRTQMPKSCVPGAFSACPSAFHCEKSHKSAIRSSGICCKRRQMNGKDGQPDGCPPGESVLFREFVVVQCDPFNTQDKSCPARFTCQFASIHQRYQCCAKTSVDGGGKGKMPPTAFASAVPRWDADEQRHNGCPGGQIAALDPKVRSVRLCTVSAPTSCPQGFSCQFSEQNAQFQCCAHKAGCPGQSVAFVNSSGTPRKCSFYTPQPMQCPVGFACREISLGVEICCTVGDVGGESDQTSAAGDSHRQMATSTKKPMARHSVGKGGKRPGENGSKQRTCRLNEMREDGQCRPRKLGDACSVSEDCPRTSECIENVCKCAPGASPTGEVNCKLEKDTHGEGHRRGGKKSKVRGERQSRIGQSCRTSKQCEWNGAKCVLGLCQCAGGTAAFRNGCQSLVCGGDHFRLPQLGPLGSVVQCAEPAVPLARCLWPHSCVFSRSLHAYICCRTATARVGTSVTGMLTVKPPERRKETNAQHSGREKRERRCSDGSRPLLLPGTQRPVQCELSLRRCPANFHCWRRLCCRRRQLRLNVRQLPAVSAWRIFAQPLADSDRTFPLFLDFGQ
uniref:BPTI/Kunitz inhibitor domain-containing protein n=1 Tax=Globodera pallida TaxID=36090 RepID=A0A183BTQ3_GLOPA